MLSRSLQSGVGLTEVVISLVVMAVLFGIALPSVGSWLRDRQVRSAAESLQSGIELARLEAVRRNARVSFRIPGVNGSLWDVGCDDSQCAQVLQAAPVAETPRVRLQPLSRSGQAITPPASVRFNGIGQAVPGGTPIGSIVINADQSNLELTLQISSAGAVLLNAERADANVR